MKLYAVSKAALTYYYQNMELGLFSEDDIQECDGRPTKTIRMFPIKVIAKDKTQAQLAAIKKVYLDRQRQKRLTDKKEVAVFRKFVLFESKADFVNWVKNLYFSEYLEWAEISSFFNIKDPNDTDDRLNDVSCRGLKYSYMKREGLPKSFPVVAFFSYEENIFEHCKKDGLLK